MTAEDTPIMVGTLIKRQGIKGFQVAEIGHPVFELNDRYIIFLKSELRLQEKVNDTTQLFYYNVAIPYYKKTLLPFIELTIN